MRLISLMLALIPAVGWGNDADVRRWCVQVKVQTANDSGYGLGSGCILDNGLILSCKHVVEGKRGESYFIRREGEDWKPASLVSVCRGVDGPALLDAGIRDWGGAHVSNGPPPVGQEVALYGYGHRSELHRDVAEVTGSAMMGRGLMPGQRTVTRMPLGPGAIKVNEVDSGRTTQGDSGGPAFNTRKEVVGVILAEGTSSASVSLASWAATNEAYQQSLRRYPRIRGGAPEAAVGDRAPLSLPLVTVAVAPGCAPCEALKRDNAAGRFSDLAVLQFVAYDDAAHGAPLGEAIDGHYGAPVSFNGSGVSRGYAGPAAYRRWLKALGGVQAVPPEPPREELTPFDPPPEMPEKNGNPQPVPPAEEETKPAEEPEAKPEALIDIPWQQVRFGVLVGADQPIWFQGEAFRIVVQKALDKVSGRQLVAEIIWETQEPEKFHQLAADLGARGDSRIYPFVTIGRMAHVGFVKGRILQKIEATIDEKVDAEGHVWMPDLVMERNNPAQFAAVNDSLGGYIAREDLPQDSQSLLSILFGALLGAVKVRGVRYFMDWWKERKAGA